MRSRPLPRNVALIVVVGLVVGLIASVSAPMCRAAPRLPAVFSDHMVMQRDARVPVWGWADPGERITVAFKGQAVSARADDKGRWRVMLEPMEADATPASLVVTGETTVAFSDVLVGEVWLASGQSNMEWPLRRSARGEAEMAAADFPLIREFAVRRTTAAEPRDDCTGAWSLCRPVTAGDFSAVAYYFARELFAELGVPVGIVKSVWGGTPVEAWTSLPALAHEPALINLFVRWERALGEYPERRTEYEAALATWQQQRDAAQAAGQAFSARRPAEPRGPLHFHRPANLFNGMIHPLIPYGLRGVIWYQGETNAANPEEYAVSFPLLIRDWRKWWDAGDVPFYFVQLANYRAEASAVGGTWPWLRDVQTRTLALPNTGMAVTIDIGEADDIHPRNKRDVGHRLARLALNRTYGRMREDAGPTFRKMHLRGAEVELEFEHAASGLRAQGEQVTGFAMAGADRVFHAAAARIAGERIVLVCAQVPAPVAVRYAWEDFPDPPATLMNGAGLPAEPFRTDEWPRAK